MVEAASKLAAAVPLATHPVGLWFRPLIARRLTGEGISTSIAPTARGCSTSVSRATRSATRMTWATTGITGRDRGASAALATHQVSTLRRWTARMPAGRLWRPARARASAAYARRPDDGGQARAARLAPRAG